ncbi:MAG: phosphoribosylaminoimidazolesuccinocarboxamide synthase [Planctomycetota bacterium]
MPSTPPKPPLLSSQVPGCEPVRGKVRDGYDLPGGRLLVATDRISAFDWVLPTGVPDKGRVLTCLSDFWFRRLEQTLGVAHHLITCDVAAMGLPAGSDLDVLAGRTMLARKATVVPFECVVRGYLAGSGWREYRESGAVCGVELPPGLRESDRLPEPIFTPATKAAGSADAGGAHDENVPFERMVADLGEPLANELRKRSLAIYQAGADHAADRGILLADTKFEFGLVGNDELVANDENGENHENDGGGSELILIDEVLTPDSSRYWPADAYEPGHGQPSFDKQFVRDWLLSTDWDRASPPPALPAEVVAKTREKYIEAYERLTGEAFPYA